MKKSIFSTLLAIILVAFAQTLSAQTTPGVKALPAATNAQETVMTQAEALQFVEKFNDPKLKELVQNSQNATTFKTEYGQVPKDTKGVKVEDANGVKAVGRHRHLCRESIYIHGHWYSRYYYC